MELKVVRDFIDRLNEDNLLYCHWKSNQHVEDAFSGIDDIDLLISQSDILKLNIILNELGYKRFRLPDKRSYIGIEDYLGYDNEKGIFVHLHLHYQLTLGEKFLKGYQIPFANNILENRIYDHENMIFISSYEDEMWLLLLRSALKIRNRDSIKQVMKKDIFGQSTLNEYLWLKNKIDANAFKNITINLLGQRISEEMLIVIQDGMNFNNIKVLRKLIRNKLFPFKSSSYTGAYISRWSRELFRVRQEVNNKILKMPKSYRRTPVAGGKIVAFLGPDGAGKSTVLKEIEKNLNSVMDVQNIYLGSGDGSSSLLRWPLKFLYKSSLKKGILNRKSKRFDKDGNSYRIGEDKKGSQIRRIAEIPWTFTLSKERIKNIRKISRFRSKGYVVITDRYPQMQFPGISDGPRFYLNQSKEKNRINNSLGKIEKESFDLGSLVAPDMIVILKVSSDVAYNRKPEEIELETHENLMKTILSLEFKNSKRIIIDADQPLTKVILDATAAIWRGL